MRVGFLGNFRRFVVADVRVQRGHQHQPLFQVFRHFLGIRLQAGDAMLLEVAAAVAQQTDRLQQIVDDHRFEHVQLQMPLTRGETDGDVIAQHLTGQHRQGFALGRVDLAGHDRAPRFVGRQFHLGQSGTWPGTQQAQVVGDFHQRHGEGFQRAGQRGQRLVAGQRGEFVGRGDERQAGKRGQLCCDGLTETVGRIQPGTHRGTALGQFANRRQRAADRSFGVIQLRDECRDFLAEGNRRRVHHVRAAGLDQLHVARCQLGQAARQFVDRRQQMMLHGLGRSNVHGGGEAVVGALGAIDVIVGVHRRLSAARVAGQLVGAPGDHFVDVHVALGTATGLPDHQGKLIVMAAVEHFIGCLFDQSGDVGGQIAIAVVDPGGRFLDQRQAMEHGQRHAFGANGKVNQ